MAHPALNLSHHKAASVARLFAGMVRDPDDQVRVFDRLCEAADADQLVEVAQAYLTAVNPFTPQLAERVFTDPRLSVVALLAYRAADVDRDVIDKLLESRQFTIRSVVAAAQPWQYASVEAQKKWVENARIFPELETVCRSDTVDEAALRLAVERLANWDWTVLLTSDLRGVFDRSSTNLVRRLGFDDTLQLLSSGNNHAGLSAALKLAKNTSSQIVPLMELWKKMVWDTYEQLRDLLAKEASLGGLNYLFVDVVRDETALGLLAEMDPGVYEALSMMLRMNQPASELVGLFERVAEEFKRLDFRPLRPHISREQVLAAGDSYELMREYRENGPFTADELERVAFRLDSPGMDLEKLLIEEFGGLPQLGVYARTLVEANLPVVGKVIEALSVDDAATILPIDVMADYFADELPGFLERSLPGVRLSDVIDMSAKLGRRPLVDLLPLLKE